MKIFRNRGISYYELSFIIIIIIVIFVGTYNFFKFRKVIRLVSCKHTLPLIENALNSYEDETGKSLRIPLKEIDLKLLFDKKYLNVIPQCGEEGIYKCSINGEVYCDYHNHKNVEE